MQLGNRERLTVIFIGNNIYPSEIAMFTREKSRYGGGLVTGIGGHFEPDKDKTILASAQRELSEEVPDWSGTELTEFARCILRDEKILFYFFGVQTGSIPKADEREGILAWVPIGKVLSQKIFPSTRPVLKEWQRRNWSIQRPWTVFLTGIPDKNGISQQIDIRRLKEGLEDI